MKDSLIISEIFDSVQGETSFAGEMTSFIRCTGCPFRCHWCDSQFAYQAGLCMSLEEIVQQIDTHPWKHVCVTGGEPLAQPATISLLQQLVETHIVSLETGGSCSTADVPDQVHTILDIKCPGSGMSERNIWGNIAHLKPHDEVKFVIASHDDYLWAKQIISSYHLIDRVQHVLIGGIWGFDLAMLISWIRQDRLPVRFNPQLHKWIFGPFVQGV